MTPMATPAAEHDRQENVGRNEPELLRRMVDIIVRDADPEAIIMFGSRTRGDARPDSDVDLLVIEREPFGPGRRRGCIGRLAIYRPPRTCYCIATTKWQAGGARRTTS